MYSRSTSSIPVTQSQGVFDFQLMKLQQQFTTTLLLDVSGKRPKLEQTWDYTVSLPLPKSSLNYFKQMWRDLENAKKLSI